MNTKTKKTKGSSKTSQKSKVSSKRKASTTKKNFNKKDQKKTRKELRSSSKEKLPTKYKNDEDFIASIEPYKLRKNEKYMNARQKKHFFQILNKWKNQLLVEQNRTADKIQNNASNFPDEADRATHEEEFTLELKTRERERRLLTKIGISIEEIESNNYGICTSCGIEIGIRRLEARTTATRCIDCKTLEEIHERQKYG